jgi:hypothetical protein
MPWRLLFFAALIVLLAFFFGFNISNRCDISFIFVEFKNVSIVTSLASAFALGVIVSLPFALVGHKKKQKKGSNAQGAYADGAKPETKPAKFSKLKKKSSSETMPDGDLESDDLIREKLGQESPRGKIFQR